MRFEVIDPTDTGYLQVIDTRDRTPLPPAKEDPDTPRWGGVTYSVAIYTPHCRNAASEAAGLAARLNAMGATVFNGGESLNPESEQAWVDAVAEVKILQTNKVWKGNVQVDETKEVRSKLSVARFSRKWCPNPERERDSLLARLKAAE